MPYIEYLFCERCGDYAQLDIDSTETIKAYRQDDGTQVAISQPLLLWNYLIYSCGICGSKYRYTFRDVERRVREYFSNLSGEYREYFDEVIRRAEEREGSAQLEPISQPLPEKNKPTAETRVRDRYTAKK
jgi:hypothetical protein